MIPLPKILKKNGMTMTQVCRGNQAFLYKDRGSEYYEVFKLKTKNDHYLFGHFVSARERYPNNNAFGNWAFCYTDILDAFEKFYEIGG